MAAGIKHIVGIAGHVGFCALENKIVYAAAKQVIVHNVETNCQQFINSDAVCLATNQKRTLLAVAVKGSNEVEIYDANSLQCKTKLHHPKITSDVSHISFSRESAILTLTNDPDFTMTLFTVNKTTAEAVASLNLSTVMEGAVLQAEFSPKNSNVISVIGSNEVRMFRPSAKMNSRFLPLSLDLGEQQRQYTAQCWLPSGNLVVATTKEILVIGENRSVRQVIETLPSAARCITSCPKGFVVGCSGGGFFLFKQSNDVETFVVKQSLTLPEKAAIRALELVKMSNSNADNDDSSFQVVCLSETNELIRFPLAECDNEALATAVPSLNTRVDSKLAAYVPSFGSLSLDASIWLPLVAVGGYDGILRIYNHCTKTIELCHPINESITGVSFHYAGKHVLLSTSKKVCLCSIYQHKLNILWQVVDLGTASIVKFSPGGDRFGIVMNSIVQVHDFYSTDFQNVGTLRGHSKPIIAFEFGPYHEEGCTIGADAIICLWDCRKGVVLKRINLLCPSILSGCVDWIERCALVTTADNYIKKVSMEGKVLVDIKCSPNDRIHMVLPSKTLICSSKGTIQSVQIQDNNLVREHVAHGGNLASAAYEDASNNLLIAGDGCLITYNANEDASMPFYHPFEDIVLISPSVLTDIENDITTTKSKIKSLKADHASKLEKLNADADLQVAQSNNALHEELERVRSESSRLMKDIDEVKVSAETSLDALKAEHKMKMLSIRTESENKIAKEKDNIVAFERRCQEIRRTWNDDVAHKKENHARTIQHETSQLHQLMTAANNQCEEIIKSIDEKKLEVNQSEQKREDATEKEISELWLAHNKEMKRIKRSNQLLLNEV